MEILIKKDSNLVVMLGNNITYVNDNGNQFYYSIDVDKPWQIQKVHVKNETDFTVIDITGVSIPDDNLDFKYTYDSELKEFTISEEWRQNQLE